MYISIIYRNLNTYANRATLCTISAKNTVRRIFQIDDIMLFRSQLYKILCLWIPYQSRNNTVSTEYTLLVRIGANFELLYFIISTPNTSTKLYDQTKRSIICIFGNICLRWHVYPQSTVMVVLYQKIYKKKKKRKETLNGKRSIVSKALSPWFDYLYLFI